MQVPAETGFVEIGDRCWLARFDFLDVNVGVVGGDRGLLLVDTQTSEAAARRMVEEVRRLGAGAVVAVVNTHEHFDHTFGNLVLVQEYDAPPIFAHETAAARMAEAGAAVQEEARRLADHPETEEDRTEANRARHREIADTRLFGPSRTFSSAVAVDLGGRLVELVHPGRGHTGGDVVVRVDDAEVLFAGDLVEESALRGGVPGFGDDCYPLEWPGTLDLVLQLLGDDAVVAPGHGNPVDPGFVREQRHAIGVVAETIRELAGSGVPASRALDATQWPYPREELRYAVARGYAQLPRSARSLPLA